MRSLLFIAVLLVSASAAFAFVEKTIESPLRETTGTFSILTCQPGTQSSYVLPKVIKTNKVILVEKKYPVKKCQNP